MDKFINDLEEIILKNSIFENDDLSKFKHTERLLLGFALLKIFDSALKYSNKNIYLINTPYTESPIDIVDKTQNQYDETVYIDKIFNLTELEYFDRGIIEIFDLRTKEFRENFFQKNFSFGFESRLDMLSSIIKANEKCFEHTLKYYPKDKLRQSRQLQEEFNGDLPAAALTEEKIYFILSEYIKTFNLFFKKYFDSFNFTEEISNLKNNFFLSDLIKDLSNIEISKENFLNPQSFIDVINNFFRLFEEKYSSISKDYSDVLLMDSSLINMECYDLKEILVDLLFTDINLNNYSEINIYDPFYFSRKTVDNSKEHIYSINKKCKVNLYKRVDAYNLFKSSNINSNISFCTVLESMLLSKDYISFSKVFNSNTFNYLNDLDFDFIISDHRSKDISEEIGFIHQFQDQLNNSIKLVAIIDINQFNNKSINWMIKNDNLEALFVFNDCFILIANSNKPIKKKNKFILIDYNILADLYDDETQKNNGIVITKKRYSKKNILKMLKVYRDFEENEFSKVINNNTVVKDFVYDELDKYWGWYYKNDLKSLLGHYHNNDFWNLMKIHDKNFENIPDDVLEISKEILNNNYHSINGISKLTNIDFYLKDFNYNNLMHDKKRKPYTISKQEKLGGNKSKIVEKTIKSIPLYKLITFNPLEFDKEILEKRKIELFGEIFYLKSDKFLRKFISVFLQTGMGIEEYDFFKSKNICGSKKDFIYIRIPDIPFETQQKIVKAYELNEEHYKLVKQSRDNFRKNILDYEKIEKDMEKFNKIEIDINTGQIIEMSTVKRHMFDGLLWPLSISYLNAVHGTHVSNPNEKLDFYLKLFEFLTAFIDIILISAIPEESYNSLKEELWKGISDNYSYKASFGTWTTVYHKLLDLYDERNIEVKFNNELIESLLNVDIYEIMDEVREIRNEFPGHGVSISESRAKQLIDDLKLKIDIVYDIFSYLTGFKLFYSVKVLELLDDGSNLYEVVSLNGPCDQPIYGEVTFNKRLKNNSLYLNNSMDGDLLELNKHLIKFEEVIEEYNDKKGRKKQRATGRFYLYLFNGFKKKKNKVQVKYKCYQVETDEIRKNISLQEWEELM